MFYALALVCDEFFVPSLDVITEKVHYPLYYEYYYYLLINYHAQHASNKRDQIEKKMALKR